MLRARRWAGFLIACALLTGLAWLLGRDGSFPTAGWLVGIGGIVAGFLGWFDPPRTTSRDQPVDEDRAP